MNSAPPGMGSSSCTSTPSMSVSHVWTGRDSLMAPSSQPPSPSRHMTTRRDFDVHVRRLGGIFAYTYAHAASPDVRPDVLEPQSLVERASARVVLLHPD